MDEQFVKVGDVELCYEAFGPEDGEPLLLIMGLGTQMLGWNDDFCAGLAERGYRVVRYDNRDIGRSTHFSEHPPPTPLQLVRRQKAAAAYTLEDMADDAAGLMTALGWDSAHVCGASMGGMIAQALAAGHPERVRSLSSIMSTTGSWRAGQPALKMYPILLKRAPRDRDAYIDHIVTLFTAIGSPGFPRDEAEMRDSAGRSYDRMTDRTGTGPGRQLGAIIASGDRTTALRELDVPALVIHGTKDPMVNVSGGRATAKAIPGAKLLLIEGMGHDLPRAAWPRMIDAIAANAARAGARLTAAA
jgi:pimeloyl-ACP methyl ester carboxylesterase